MKKSICYISKYKGMPIINGIYYGEDFWELLELKINEFIINKLDIKIHIDFLK